MAEIQLKQQSEESSFGLLKLRESAPYRIITGATFTTIFGTYVGDILYNMDRLQHAKTFRLSWFKGSALLSLGFFSNSNTLTLQLLAANELVYSYFESSNIYHNFWIDYSLAGYASYSVLFPYLRRHLLTERNSEIKKRCQKYCLSLAIYGMLFERYLEFKRTKIILESIKHEDSPYLIRPEEEETIKKLLRSKQFALFNLAPKQYADDDDEEEVEQNPNAVIGGFIPFVAVHEEREEQIVQMNSDVNEKLGNAIKQLILHSNSTPVYQRIAQAAKKS